MREFIGNNIIYISD